MLIKRLAATAAGTAALVLSFGAQASAPAPDAVLTTYADIAYAGYSDSLATAKELKAAVDKLIAEPTEENLAAAREAWTASRVPYQQTEAYRFGNAVVDDWEGKVNAWPLDEGLIDYVAGQYGDASDENAYYTANVIANPSLTVGGSEIDASEITPSLLEDELHEVDEVEANVATGYHAIEFLLWGQDLHGTDAGAGERPATDFDPANCTGGNCDRRIEYLTAATDLLISDLEWMTAQWAEGGEAREGLVEGDAQAGLATMLTGMGSLSYGELAGERMQLGLMLHDPEEEHDCFSDNTHFSHYYDAKGIKNVYVGEYDGVVTDVDGASLSDLVAAKDAALDEKMRAALNNTMEKMQAIVDRAKDGEAYDQQIGDGNPDGNAAVQAAVDALKEQTKVIEQVVATLDLGDLAFEGSDSLDNPSAVFE